MDTTNAIIHAIPLGALRINDIETYHDYWLNDYMFYAVLAIMVLAGFARMAFSGEFKLLFTVFRNITLSDQLQRNRPPALNILFIVLNILFVLALTLFIYQISLLTKLAHMYTPLIRAGFLGEGVALFVLLRMFLQRLVGAVFNINKEISLYIFNVMQINRIIGLLLVPGNLIVMFIYPPWQKIGFAVCLAIIAGLLIYRYYLGYLIGRSRLKGSVFHFLLYICTLEIAPIAIVVKLLIPRL